MSHEPTTPRCLRTKVARQGQTAGFIDDAFRDGGRAFEDEYTARGWKGRGAEALCPYPAGSVGAHWWTRGYSYEVRIIRAICAENERDKLKRAKARAAKKAVRT